MKEFTVFLPIMVICILMGSMIVSNCNAEEVKSEVTKTLDPCTLLTKAEIAGIIGKPVEDGKLNANANPTVGQPCEFKVGDYGVFSLWIGQNQIEACDQMMAELKKQEIKTTEVSGVGDRSFVAHHAYGMLQLNTWKGSNYFIITTLIPGMDEAQQITVAEKLMRLALEKL